MKKYIDVHGILKQFDYLDVPLNKTTRKAAAIVKELQRRIDARAQAIRPGVLLQISHAWMSIEIGGITVWDTENDTSDNLSTVYCWSAYMKEIEALADLLPKKRRKR